MSSISRWPRASMQAMHSRSCCSLPRMMRLSCAIVAPTSSIGSAWVISVGMAASIVLRLQRRDAPLLLFNLRDLTPEIDDALTLQLHGLGPRIRDEVLSRQL